MVALLAIGCETPELVEIDTKAYYVNSSIADDGTLMYEEIWLPEQRTGFFTDAGHANGSGKAYSAFAHVGDTITVMFRNNEHGRYFQPMINVSEVMDVDGDNLEIRFSTRCFKDVTATFKYNATFSYQID